MAEGMSSVAIGCHCDDSEDPFLHNRWYSNTRRCEFEADCVVSDIYLFLKLHLIAVCVLVRSRTCMYIHASVRSTPVSNNLSIYQSRVASCVAIP